VVGLRIDVDFVAGLERAVPWMLDRLRSAGLRATFFVVAGSNRPGTSLRRLTRPGYARRLLRLGPWAIARGLGRSLGGDGGFLETETQREILRRLVDEGHELAVHGFDHAWWADHAWTATLEQLEAEIERGFEAMRASTGLEVEAWGSPNWRSNDAVAAILQRRGAPYLAECWGREPFVMLDGRGREIPLVHLPISMPSLESLVFERRLDPTRAIDLMVSSPSASGIDVACMHDYFEGLLRPDLFERFVRTFATSGRKTVTLAEIERAVRPGMADLPRSRMTAGELPGFAGEVCWQA
jgi:peptidoglycan/xylan/chitin deacetylase (PgdA/CDA1 family)